MPLKIYVSSFSVSNECVFFNTCFFRWEECGTHSSHSWSWWKSYRYQQRIFSKGFCERWTEVSVCFLRVLFSFFVRSNCFRFPVYVDITGNEWASWNYSRGIVSFYSFPLLLFPAWPLLPVVLCRQKACARYCHVPAHLQFCFYYLSRRTVINLCTCV